MGKGRQKDRVEAMDLVCYWVANELGISITGLARKFKMSASGASYAVKRGEVIVNENKYQLENFLRSVKNQTLSARTMTATTGP